MRYLYAIFLVISLISTSSESALSQEYISTTNNDILIIDKLINSDKIDVFVARNGAVDQRARACSKLFPTKKGLGVYKTSGQSLVYLKSNHLDYIDDGGEILEDYGKGDYTRCYKKQNNNSSNLKTIHQDNIPIIISSTLKFDVCYMQMIYDNCTSKCVTSAPSGSNFFYIVVSKDFAESISKTSCE